MIALSDAEALVDKRIVLTCDSEVTYAGSVKVVHEFDGRPGILLRVDPASGFSVWCPINFVKEAVVIPIDPDSEE